jgi:DNA (cytosine-5)-methyltransferase 1
MRYGQQYDYRCPNVFCRGALVQPYALPAAAAIDWSVVGQRIGDRTKALQPKTLARIEAGLRRYAQPITLEAAGHTFERRPGVRTRPADQPLTVLHTTTSKGLAVPPMLVPAGGGWNDEARSITEPMRARTTRETEGIACPPLVVPLRTHGTASATDRPLKTFVAGNVGMALVEPMLVPVEGREGKQARPVSTPMRAQTARHENALVVPLRNNGVARPAHGHPLVTFAASGTHQGLLYGYDTGNLRPVTQPMPSQTTVQGDALLGAAIAVDDCTFRMLDVDEIRAGMAFSQGYILLGNKRERVRMLGNAVTPPSARDLVAAVVEAITGHELELAS